MARLAPTGSTCVVVSDKPSCLVIATPSTFIELATAHVAHIAALIIGGLLAAPFGAYIVRYVQARALMTAVGVLVSALALFQLAKSFG